MFELDMVFVDVFGPGTIVAVDATDAPEEMTAS